jgi:hypothetical protein
MFAHEKKQRRQEQISSIFLAFLFKEPEYMLNLGVWFYRDAPKIHKFEQFGSR